MIRAIAVVLVASAITVGVAACGSDVGNDASATPSRDYTPVTALTVAPGYTTSSPTTTRRPGELTGQDRVFLSQLNDYWRTVDNADLIELATKTCDKLRGGVDKTTLLHAFVGGDMDSEGTITTTGGNTLENGVNLFSAAVTGYCPEYLTGVK